VSLIVNSYPIPLLPAGLAFDEMDEVERQFARVELENAAARAVAGVLASDERARDLKLHSVTITFHGREIVNDAKIEFNMGQRYGLVGVNGCGELVWGLSSDTQLGWD
jgi:ATP-binding cassette subfamily F protein 2